MNDLRDWKSSETPDSALNTLFFPTYQGFSAQRPVGTDCAHHHPLPAKSRFAEHCGSTGHVRGLAAGGRGGVRLRRRLRAGRGGLPWPVSACVISFPGRHGECGAETISLILDLGLGTRQSVRTRVTRRARGSLARLLMSTRPGGSWISALVDAAANRRPSCRRVSIRGRASPSAVTTPSVGRSSA